MAAKKQKEVTKKVIVSLGYDKKDRVKEAFATVVKYVASAFIFVVDDKYFINAGEYSTETEAKSVLKKIIKDNPNIEMNIE